MFLATALAAAAVLTCEDAPPFIDHNEIERVAMRGNYYLDAKERLTRAGAYSSRAFPTYRKILRNREPERLAGHIFIYNLLWGSEEDVSSFLPLALEDARDPNCPSAARSLAICFLHDRGGQTEVAKLVPILSEMDGKKVEKEEDGWPVQAAMQAIRDVGGPKELEALDKARESAFFKAHPKLLEELDDCRGKLKARLDKVEKKK